MSGSADRLDWVDTAKGISIILVVMMYSVFNVGQDTGGVGHLPLRHRLRDAVPDARILPDFRAVPQPGDRPPLARLRRSPRRPLPLFLRPLGGDPHRRSRSASPAAHRSKRCRTSPWPSSSPMACCGSSTCSQSSALAAKLALSNCARRTGPSSCFGALLQMSGIATGSYLVDQFCHYFVYFYSGYAFAPVIFRLVDWALNHTAVAVIGALASTASINAALVFSPAYDVLPTEIQLGSPACPACAWPSPSPARSRSASSPPCSPPDHHELAALARRTLARRLPRLRPADGVSRRLLLGKLGLIQDVTLSSFLVIVIAIGVSRWRSTGSCRRPAAASSSSSAPPGPTCPAPGSRSDAARQHTVPAE